MGRFHLLTYSSEINTEAHILANSPHSIASHPHCISSHESISLHNCKNTKHAAVAE